MDTIFLWQGRQRGRGSWLSILGSASMAVSSEWRLLFCGYCHCCLSFLVSVLSDVSSGQGSLPVWVSYGKLGGFGWVLSIAACLLGEEQKRNQLRSPEKKLHQWRWETEPSLPWILGREWNAQSLQNIRVWGDSLHLTKGIYRHFYRRLDKLIFEVSSLL